MSNRKRILLMVDWFDPAYKAGGPIRSAVNFVQHMKSDYDLFVFTSDSDHNQTKPLEGVKSGEWMEYADNVKVFYAGSAERGIYSVKKIINSLQADFVYLNSVFSRSFTIYPLLLKYNHQLGNSKIVMSPRGMLRPSALQYKPLKKRIYLSIMKLTGILSKIRFIATDQDEAKDIEKQFGKVEINTASNFGAAIIAYEKPIEKKNGEIAIIFVGRVHPIKNLHFLLQSLQSLKGKVKLSIVGMLEDSSYWRECEAIISRLSATVEVEFKGDLPHHELSRLIADHHIFALPTQGENYGHAIFEALSHGKPVVISDQTPWRNLSTQNAGWDLPLQDSAAFSEVIQGTINWDQDVYNLWSNGARKKAETAADYSLLKNIYKKIFT